MSAPARRIPERKHGMKKQYIIGLDLGTTALKIGIFDQNGELVGVSTQEYQLITPQVNYVEEDLEVYWNSFRAGLNELLTKNSLPPEDIVSLSFSAQGETLAFMGKDGKPLRNAIVWLDNRAQKQADELRAALGGDEVCYRVTGQVSFEACWPASKVLWVRENEPEIFAKIDKIILLEDYFIHRMCGRYVAEGSLLCSTTYWDINTKKYWPEMLEVLGITEDMLPEIMESGEPVGQLLPDVARELGLTTNLTVCTGALDQAAGAMGVGNIHEGMISENIGAALAICVPVNKPVFDPNRQMPLHYFPIPDTYMIHTFTNGGMTLRWFRDAFCQMEMGVAGIDGEDAYDIIGREVMQVAPGSDGLIMLPHLAGSNAPDVKSNAKGVFYGFTLLHRKAHFARAIMESLAYIVRRNLEALESMGITVSEIRSLGGGSKSAVWNQIKADVLGCKLMTMTTKEAACLGAAILAGKAVGLFPSLDEAVDSMSHVKNEFYANPDNKAVYDRCFAAYKDLFKSLDKVFDQY